MWAKISLRRREREGSFGCGSAALRGMLNGFYFSFILILVPCLRFFGGLTTTLSPDLTPFNTSIRSPICEPVVKGVLYTRFSFTRKTNLVLLFIMIALLFKAVFGFCSSRVTETEDSLEQQC